LPELIGAEIREEAIGIQSLYGFGFCIRSGFAK